MTEIRPETATAKTFRLALTEPSPYLAGQHYIVRLTAPDGYTASRSYSVASAPDDSGEIELTVERLPEGEVSSFLHDVVMVGDELEVRGPIGGWFVWPGDTPAVLVAGGSGVVPLMAMLRLARRRAGPTWSTWSCRPATRPACTTPTNCPARNDDRLHPRHAAVLAPPGRAPAPRRPARAAARGRHRLHLRLVWVRRRRHDRSARRRDAGPADQGGAVRADRIGRRRRIGGQTPSDGRPATVSRRSDAQ